MGKSILFKSASAAVLIAISSYATVAGAATVVDAGNMGAFGSDGAHVSYNFNFATGLSSSAERRSFFSFDLSSLSGQAVTAASLHLFDSTQTVAAVNYGYDSADATETVNLYDVSAANTANLASMAYGTNPDLTGQGVFADLGSGTLIGTATITKAGSGVGSYVDISFNAAGLFLLTSNAGGQVAMGAALGSLAGNSGNQTLFSAWNNNNLSNPYPYLDGTHAQLVMDTTPVPLPAGVWLLGRALGGLGALRRRRKAQA